MFSSQDTSIEELEAQLAKSTINENYIDLLNQLSRMTYDYEDEVNISKGCELAHRAYNLVIQKFPKYEKGLADSLLNLAWCEHHQQNTQQSVELALQAEAIYQRNEDDEGLFRLNYIMAWNSFRIADYTSLLDYAIQGLHHANIFGDPKAIAIARMDIGTGYACVTDYIRAIENYKRAETMLVEINNRKDLGILKFNMASCYRFLGRLEEALESAFQSYQLLKSDQSISTAIVTGIIGHIYYDQAEYDTALAYQQRKLELVNILDNDYLRTYTLCDLGIVYFAQGKIDEARQHLEAGISLGQEKQLNQAVIEKYPHLIDVYKHIQDYESALRHHEQMLVLYQQINNEKEDIRRKTLMVRYETQQALNDAQIERERAKEIEKQVVADRQYFEELNNIKDEFFQSATHDLKNPLAAIILETYILRTKVDESVKHRINTIETQAQKMNGLIGDMLELAKLETGRALNLKKNSMANLITQVIRENQVAATAKQTTVEFIREDAHREYVFFFDKKYLHRVLDNLVSNAIKYSPEQAHVQIRIQQMGDNIQIVVEDNGYGIPKEALPKIFDRFYRVANKQMQEISGTGLGLSIVKSIIDQHRGLITVESDVGVGTIFRFTLPFEEYINGLTRVG